MTLVIEHEMRDHQFSFCLKQHRTVVGLYICINLPYWTLHILWLCMLTLWYRCWNYILCSPNEHFLLAFSWSDQHNADFWLPANSRLHDSTLVPGTKRHLQSDIADVCCSLHCTSPSWVCRENLRTDLSFHLVLFCMSICFCFFMTGNEAVLYCACVKKLPLNENRLLSCCNPSSNKPSFSFFPA